MKKLFLIGLPGAGKSYWTKCVSEDIRYQAIDLDHEIVLQAGKSIAEIFQTDGEATFRALENEVLKHLCATKEAFILACGGGTPCFHDNLTIMKAYGQVVYLRAASPYIIKHLQHKEETVKRPLFQGGGETVLKRVNQLLSERKSSYEKADHIIDIDRLSNEQVLSKLKEIISD